MKGDQSYELPMTHIERMDLEQLRHQQNKELAQIQADRDIKVAKEERKADRSEMWMVIGIATAIAAVLITCAYAWWIDEEPVTQESYKTSEAYREERCVESGGGWIPKDMLVDYADQGLCVYPGKSVEVAP